MEGTGIGEPPHVRVRVHIYYIYTAIFSYQWRSKVGGGL